MIVGALLVGILSGLLSTGLALSTGMGLLPSLLLYPAAGMVGMMGTVLLSLSTRRLAAAVAPNGMPRSPS
jgi:hypothetical protein